MEQITKLLNPSTPLGGAETPWIILISLLIAGILSWLVAHLYMKTHQQQTYSQSFVQTLMLLSVTVAAVMAIIGNNLARAFGLVGAVAIIRFRTRVKDPRDMAFLFLTIAIGMACGLRLYIIATVTTLFMLVLVGLLWKVDFGNPTKGIKRSKDSYAWNESEEN